MGGHRTNAFYELLEKLVEPGHALAYNASTRFARLTLSGLWDRDSFEGFQRDISSLAARVAHLPPEGRLLIDLRDFPIQLANIAESLQPMLPLFGTKVGRMAVLASGSMLQKFQVQRVLAISNLRLFQIEADAMRWLFPDRAAAPL
jgi:hypothetical protein